MEQLLQRARGNDRDAFRQLVAEHQARVFTIALRLAGQRADANWRGEWSTGSTWTRKGEGSQSFFGTPGILDIGQGVYEIGFTVANRGQ
jgi:hypothetical protein